jgi:uncharacterized integral membrane protein
MKKVKVIIWVLVVGFVVLAVFQNQNYFVSEQQFELNLFFAKYQTPALANGLIVLVSFVLGLLIAYFFNLAERLRTRKATKKLNATIASNQTDLSALRNELTALKNNSSEEVLDNQ